jgi:putative FmdB family regulatory protein
MSKQYDLSGIGTISLMPTYQYACTVCNHEFEVVQTFTDKAIEKCPKCAELVRKKFSSVGVVFKGSGFYQTDSREKKTKETTPKKDDKAKETPKKEVTPLKTETKSESKPEKKVVTPKTEK